jgi:hypothetical protein
MKRRPRRLDTTAVIASQRVGAKRRPMTGTAKQSTAQSWIASSLTLLAMTWRYLPSLPSNGSEPVSNQPKNALRNIRTVMEN